MAVGVDGGVGVGVGGGVATAGDGPAEAGIAIHDNPRKEGGMSEGGSCGGIACGKGGCRHLDQDTVETMWAEVEGQRRTRAANMPTEQRAISTLFDAWYRLKELGWSDARYVPRDGRLCEFIECGSTGIHQGHADEKGRIWLQDDGDLWPSKPVLFRILPEKAGAP